MMRSTETASSGASGQQAGNVRPQLRLFIVVLESTCFRDIGRLQRDVGEKCAYMGQVVQTNKTVATSFKSSSGRVDRFPRAFCRVAS
jgi:hypothetical protein